MSDKKDILVFSNNEGIAHFAVNKWTEISSGMIADKGYFTVAISGGRTPIDFYKKLSLCKGPLPWEKTHIFLADERFVPLSHKESNYHLIQEYLLNSINIPKENAHTIQTEENTVEQSAKRYEEHIRSFFHIWNDRIPEFDLIMLCIGEDGHIASLFPGASSLREKTRLVIPVVADKLPNERITLTLPLINNAKHIIFLVSGKNKARAVQEMLEDRKTRLPAALVKPDNGALFLVMDQDAASLLSNFDSSIYRFSFHS